MAQLETFASYFSRLLTFQDFLWIGFIWLIGFFLRKPLANALGISSKRYLLVELAFAGVIGLSLRFWVATGTLSTFWLVAPEVWSAGFHINANLLLNICLYVPPTVLLILARKTWWKVALGFISLSFTVETIQQYARIGQGDPMDWFANCLGAALGIGIGLLLRLVFPTLSIKKDN
jgi:glycopeptide antibiotics resistance protein